MPNERKSQIIKAAAKRFARHGLTKTTLDEVARDIRIGKATIYHYFNSKEALFVETLRWEIELFLEQIKIVLTAEEKPITEKVLEYFSLKDNVQENYKIIYETFLNYFNERILEKENEQIKFLLSKEEEILKKILSSAYKEKVMSISPALPYYLVTYSWGIQFGSKLNEGVNQSKINASKDIILKSLESLIPQV